ncbi:hypothetical protein EVAR_37133_1 [Eumeta japonica]|uniref:Uncharacterized protein n=1 Tax=Eumeta variegata TaxID=151549 RepID=A0A4C1XSV1_EUMVA|nr:hypothetical protein EVAR_37133_1 [Eumeta japonica]
MCKLNEKDGAWKPSSGRPAPGASAEGGRIGTHDESRPSEHAADASRGGQHLIIVLRSLPYLRKHIKHRERLPRIGKCSRVLSSRNCACNVILRAGAGDDCRLASDFAMRYPASLCFIQFVDCFDLTVVYQNICVHQPFEHFDVTTSYNSMEPTGRMKNITHAALLHPEAFYLRLEVQARARTSDKEAQSTSAFGSVRHLSLSYLTDASAGHAIQ